MEVKIVFKCNFSKYKGKLFFENWKDINWLCAFYDSIYQKSNLYCFISVNVSFVEKLFYK